MNEIEMMKRITSGNPHIVNMIGCVTRSEPVCLMCELVTYGSLLSYLRTHQKKVQFQLNSLLTSFSFDLLIATVEVLMECCIQAFCSITLACHQCSAKVVLFYSTKVIMYMKLCYLVYPSIYREPRSCRNDRE